MTTVPVEDRLAIQELAARYAFRCDTAAYDRCAELFTEDGVWDESVLGLPRCESRGAIHEVFCSMYEPIEYLIHINSNHQLTAFDADTAAGTVHLHAEGKYLGSEVTIFGYYVDEYARVDGEWLFSKRKLVEIRPSTGFGEPAEVSAVA